MHTLFSCKTHKLFELCPFGRLPLVRQTLVLLKITEEVDGEDMRLVQLVAIARLDSIGCFLRVRELQEEIPVCRQAEVNAVTCRKLG